MTDDRRPEQPATDGSRSRDSLYKRLLDSARDVVFVVDADGRIVEANRAAETTYGVPRDALVGTALSELRDPASLPSMPDQLAAADRGGVLFETVHRRADGGTFPVEVSSRGEDIDGQRVLVSIVRDITLRRQREMERERLAVELAEANARLDALVRITSRALATLDLDDLLHQTLQALLDVTGASAALLFESDASGLVCRADIGVEWGAFRARLVPGQGFAGQVAAAGTALYVHDVLASDFSIEFHFAAGYRSMFGVPLYLGGESYGVLELAWQSLRTIDDSEMGLIQAAAERVMLAVANARAFERTKRAQALSAALNDVNSLVNASFDLSGTMAAALRACADALECDVALLAVEDDGVWRQHTIHGAEPPDTPPADEHWTAKDVLERLSAPIAGATHRWLETDLGVEEPLALRLDVRGRQVGMLVFGRHEARAFSAQERDYAERFAGAIALALGNAEEFAAEHRIAERLQEALLTTPSSVRGVDFSHLYRSATVSTRVGGDFFDVFELAHGRVGVVVGDVSGKGLEAAVLTSVIKDTIRAFAHDVTSPAEVMSRTNVALERAAKLPEFASVVFAVVDTRTASMTYCCAGHPSPALLGADGGVRLLECTSPVIGAFEGLGYTERRVALAPGERVFLYTDGVTEARDAEGAFFGEERLVAALSVPAADLSDLPARLFEAVVEFTHGHLTDDIALLAFQLAAPDERR